MMSAEEEAKAFAAAMSALGPFEPEPHIAVAVSGGSDSLALLMMVCAWIAPRGGRLTALSVDHALRPESAAECRQIGEFIAALNAAAPPASLQIDHHILAWEGEKPSTGLMAAAREARYRLLTGWCRSRDVLHLALAHHADDQAETVLMRADHGSGAAGLAGMSAMRCQDGVRLLRPLLGWRKRDLVAGLRRRSLAWIEDPSNRADRFERVRWRRQLGEQADIAPLLAETTAAGLRRDRLERQAGVWLAEQGRIDPHGYVDLPLPAILGVAAALQEQILRQVLETIGAARFPPAPAGLAAVIDKLQAMQRANRSLITTRLTATLGGCLLAVRHGKLSVYREAEHCDGPVPVQPGQWLVWDRRFRVRVLPRKRAAGAQADVTAQSALYLAALGKYGLRGRNLPAALKSVPQPARDALPGLWQDGQLCAVGEVSAADRPPFSAQDGVSETFYKLDVSYLPMRAATSCGFTVVTPARHTM